jgi:hypothetical protein
MDPRGLFCFVPTPQEKDHSIRAVVLRTRPPSTTNPRYAALSKSARASAKPQSHKGIVKIHPLSWEATGPQRLYYIVPQRGLRRVGRAQGSWVLDRASHWIAIAAIFGERAR